MQTTYISKVTFIGNSRSGKTSIIKRYQENKFDYEPNSTIGVDFTIKEIDSKPPSQPSNIKMQIWDTAGQERFAPVIKLYFKTSYAIVVVFDLTNRPSFEHITNWIRSVRQEYEPEFYVVVGNKSDLKERIIKEQEVHTILENIRPKFEYKYIETSAKNNTNINALFQLIIDNINSKTQTDPPNIKNELSLKKVDLITETPSNYKFNVSSISSLTSQTQNCCSIQ